MKTNRILTCPLAFALALGLLLPVAFEDQADARRRRAAPAQPTNVRLDRLPDGVEDLPFGGTLEDAIKWARSRLDRAYAPKMKRALDTNERTRLQERLEGDVAGVKKSHVALDGQRSGYEVSIISGEFVPGVGESVLRFSEKQYDHYVFLSEGDLYKYAVPLPMAGTFDEQLTLLKRDHGEPTKVEHAGAGGRGEVSMITWDADRYRLRVVNRRGLFRADLLVLEDLHQIDRVLQRRGNSGRTHRGIAVEPELEDFLE